MKLTRDFYRPKDATLRVFNPDNGVEIFTYERQGQLFAAFFAGKRAKPDQHYRYSTEEKRDEAIARFLKMVGENENRKLEYKKSRIDGAKAAYENTKVGDVFVASWGYDQTNVDFFQVTEKLPGGYVMVQEIGGKDRTVESYDAGRIKPNLGSFKGEPMKKKVSGSGERPGVSISSVQWATKDQDQNRGYYWSSYA